MNLTVRQSAQPVERHRDLWSWCFAHGLIATEIADALVVDPDAGTVTVQHYLPLSQPGDPDFPELRRDEHNQPLTEVQVRPLVVPLPDGLVTELVGVRLAA